MSSLASLLTIQSKYGVYYSELLQVNKEASEM